MTPPRLQAVPEKTPNGNGDDHDEWEAIRGTEVEQKLKLVLDRSIDCFEQMGAVHGAALQSKEHVAQMRVLVEKVEKHADRSALAAERSTAASERAHLASEKSAAASEICVKLLSETVVRKTPSTPPAPLAPGEMRPRLDSLLRLDDNDITAVHQLKTLAIEAAAVERTDAKRLKLLAIVLGILVSFCVLGAVAWGIFQIAVKHAGVNAPKIEVSP